MFKLMGSQLTKRTALIQASRKLSTNAPPNPTGICPTQIPGSNQLTKAQEIVTAYKRPSTITGYFGSKDYMYGKIEKDPVFNDMFQYIKDMPLTKDDGTPGIANNVEESKQRIQELGDHTTHIIEMGKELENADSERQGKIIDSLQLLAVKYSWIWQQIAMQPLRLSQTPDGKLHGLGNDFIPRQIARPSLILAHLFRTSAQQSYARYSGPNIFKFTENVQARPDNVESYAYIEGNPRNSEGNLIMREMNYFGEKIAFPDNAEMQFQINHGLQELFAPGLIAATEMIKKGLISGNDDLLIHGYKKATEAVKPMGDIMQEMFHMSDPDQYRFIRTWLISPAGRTEHFPNGLTLEGAEDFGLPEEGHADVGETGAQASKQLLVKELGLFHTSEEHDLHAPRNQFFASQDHGSKIYALEFRKLAEQYHLNERVGKNQHLAASFLDFLVEGSVRHQDIHSTTALHYIYKAGDLTYNSGSTAADYLYSSVFKTATSAMDRANLIKIDELSSDGVNEVEQRIKYLTGIISKAENRKEWILDQMERTSVMYN